MRLRRSALAAAVLVVGMVVAARAGGYSMGRSVDVPRGGGASFLPSQWRCNNYEWRCNNYGSRVECFSGDAFPYAELTTTRGGGVTVKVHTLRDPQGGHLTRTYVKGFPVYVFTALKRYDLLESRARTVKLHLPSTRSGEGVVSGLPIPFRDG